MTSELYGLPWILYHCKYDNNDADIKLSYYDIAESNELKSSETYREILSQIAPDAPNPDNYSEYESYRNIYEKEIILANNKKVVAMVSELKSDSRIYVMFNYDGILISVFAEKEILSEAFFNHFELKEY